MAFETRLWRPAVRALVPYEPGKPIDEVVREFGVHDVVKLASNENPLGPSPRALAAATAALPHVHHYPDPGAHDLRQALAAHLGVPCDHVVTSNGTAELIELVAESFLDPGETAVTGDQAFFKYRNAVQLMDGRLLSLPMPGYAYDVDAILGALRAGAKVVFLANPNNPTGLTVPRADVDRLVAALTDDQLLVLDEAYHEYLEPDADPRSIEHVRAGRNVLILRTFSKAYALAGLRVGYAVARPDLLRAVWKVRESFCTNAVAQAAATAALADHEHLARGLAHNRAARERLHRVFAARGRRTWPSTTNFVLVDLGCDAAPIYDALLRRGVIVRPLRGYGLPTCVRVSTGSDHALDRLEEALDQVLPR